MKYNKLLPIFNPLPNRHKKSDPLKQDAAKADFIVLLDSLDLRKK
jgi:hypothetical protein